MTDHITEKAIWSATKAWYLTTNPSIKWEGLTEEQRASLRDEYLAWREAQPKSAAQLRVELRKARIDNGILQRKLDAAMKKIAMLEESYELAVGLAANEALSAQYADPTCP